jgi:hypothetical protein
MTMIHPINTNLPKIILPSLQQNDQDNLLVIQESFQTILSGHEIVNSKLFGKLLRLIESRFTLKYSLTV